jgi:hypothetical protein
MDVPEATALDVQKPGAKKRHWFRRVLLVLAVIVAGGAACGYWFLFGRVHGLAVYRTAMETIEKDKGLQSELGQPIGAVAWPPPAARIEESETDIRWDIQGSNEGAKGRAQAHLHARLIGGKPDIDVLEVLLPDGKKIPLTDAVPSDNVAKPYHSSPTKSGKPKNDAPPPDIDMPLPPDTPPEK